MRSTRTGAPPRLLPYRSPELWAVRSEFFVFQVLFGFIPLVAFCIGFQACGMRGAEKILDPSSPMVRLSQPLTEAERARGVVRAGGKLAGVEEVCELIHEYKSGKNWKVDFRTTIGVDATIDIDSEPGGVRVKPPEPLAVAWSEVTWEPEMVRSSTDREAWWRDRVKIPSGGHIDESCLRRGERVFIDACKTMGKDNRLTVTDCPNTPATLTAGNGTPQPRIDQLAAATAGEVSLLGALALIVMLYLWRMLGARPFIAGLVKRLGRPPSAMVSKPALWVMGLAPLGLLLGLFLLRGVPGGAGAAKVDRYGYAAAYAVFAGAAILGILMTDRRRVLRAVIGAVRGDGLGSIAHLREGQRVTLEAKIGARAPVSTGPLTGKSRAYWVVSSTRVYRNGRNYASSVQPGQSGPSLVPIEGPGGAAMLDLSYASVDLRARLLIARKRAMKKGTFRHIVGDQSGFDGAYVLEESYLEPGEAIYIAGQVLRLAPPSVEVGYRETGGIPVIGGTSGEPAVVHAGSRGSLLRGLWVEHGFITAALGIAGLIGAGTAGLVVYLISL